MFFFSVKFILNTYFFYKKILVIFEKIKIYIILILCNLLRRYFIIHKQQMIKTVI